MRRLTVVFLIVCICLTSMTGVTAERFSVNNLKEDFGFLSALGIMDNVSVNTDEFLNSSTRRDDFVYWTMRAAGYDTAVIDYVYAVFNDVPFTDEKCNYINFAYYMGIVSGREDFLFYPEDTITSNEAIKIIVSALGATRLAQELGGYPTGYIAAASRLGIKTSGISNGEAITNADAALLLKNMLNASLVTDDGNTIKQDNITVLERIHGVKTVNGVICSAAGTRLTLDDVYTKSNEIAIGEMKFISDSAVNDLFGKYAKVYYKEEESENILIYADVSRNEVTVIKSEDLLGVNNGTIEYIETTVSYETSSRETKLMFAGDADIIYNGRPYPTYTDDLIDISGSSGEIICICQNYSDHPDVVIVNAISNYVVSAVDAGYQTIYTSLPQGKVDLSSVERIEIFDSYGNELNFNKIFAGDVISVLKSADNSYCKIIACSKRENRKVIEIIDENKVLLDNKKIYSLDKIVQQKAEDELLIGRLIDVSYDYQDRICNFIYSQYEDGINYAYLIKVGKTNPGVDDFDVKIKLYRLTGVFEEYKLAEKIKLDGEIVKDTDFYDKFIKTDPDTGTKYTDQQMIKFELNTDTGLIKYIDSPERGAKEGEETLKVDKISSGYFVRDICSIEGKYVFDKGYFLNIPTVGAGIPAYQVKNIDDWEYFINDRLGTLEDMSGSFEIIDPDEAGWSSILVRRPDWYPDDGIPSSDEGNPAARGNMGMLDEYSHILNENGEPVIKMTFYTIAGKKTTLLLRYDYLIQKPVTDENGNVTYTNMERGDIFSYKESDGYINSLSMRFNISRTDNGRFYRSGDTNISGHVCGVAYGVGERGFALLCNEIEGGGPAFVSNVSTKDVFDYNKIYVRVPGNSFSTVTLYDKEKDVIEVGTIYDIVNCQDDDICPSILVANLSLGSITGLFAINNYK